MTDADIMMHWASTPNTGDMRVDLVVFARALLAASSPDNSQPVIADTAKPVVMPPMPENVLSDIQNTTTYLEMWAKGEARYAPTNGYDEPGIKNATITDVKKSAKYLAPRLKEASFALQDYFSAIDAMPIAAPAIDAAPQIAQIERDALKQRGLDDHIRRLESDGDKPAIDAAPEKLQVWYGPMPESNGKSNYTVILHRGDMVKGITIDQSEYPDRIRYEADRMRWMIGELNDEPCTLDYDADKHSGYVKPDNSQAVALSAEQEREAFEAWWAALRKGRISTRKSEALDAWKARAALSAPANKDLGAEPKSDYAAQLAANKEPKNDHD